MADCTAYTAAILACIVATVAITLAEWVSKADSGCVGASLTAVKQIATYWTLSAVIILLLKDGQRLKQ